MNCEQAKMGLSARLDGQLTQEETKELDDHLAICPDCQRIYQAYCALDLELADLDSPPAQLREGVMSAIRREKVVAFPKKRWMFGSGTAIAAVAAALLLVMSGYLPEFSIGSTSATPESMTVTSALESSATTTAGAVLREMESPAMVLVDGELAVATVAGGGVEEVEYAILTLEFPPSQVAELGDATVEQDANGLYHCWVTGDVIQEICANEAYGVELPVGYLDPEQMYRVDCIAP